MGDDNNGSHRNKLLIVVITVLAVAALGFGGSLVYVGTNKFCGYTCHQMKTRALIWSKSTHSQIKCIECHSEPGFIGEFEAHVDGLNYLKSFVKGQTKHLTIFATRRNPARLKSCIHCHPADKLIAETESVRVKHVSHIVRDRFLCTDCHEDMVHGAHGFEVEMTKPQEKKCIACHLREGATLHCQACHTKKVVRGERQLYVLDALKETGFEKMD